MTIMEVWGLMIKKVSLIAIILIAISASITLAFAQGTSSIDSVSAMNDSAVPDGAIAQSNASDEGTSAPGNVTSTSGSVQGIWKTTLGEKEVTLSMSQSGQSIFGLAKYEGDHPWNAALAGSMNANDVALAMAAADGDGVSSYFIGATLNGESMDGFFIRSDSSGKASRGKFSAILINPDTSGYTPASVETSASSASPTEKAVAVQKSETAAADSSNESVVASSTTTASSRFKDVTELAKGIDPNIMPRMAPL